MMKDIRPIQYDGELMSLVNLVKSNTMEGNRVIEVRNTGITKGTAALEWLARRPADFILAIGDDWTDEDLFRALPPTAFSVRIGLAQTAARYHLASHTAVRRLLRELWQLPTDKTSPSPAPAVAGEPAAG